MDEVLKLRKLGSASARKRKIRERQEKVRENKQRTLEKRDTSQFRYGYGYHSDEEELSDNEGSHNTFSPIAEADLDPAASTASPSTAGVRTPDGLPSPPYVDLDTRAASVEDSAGKHSTKDIPTPPPPPTKPLLQPTLTSRADFNFEFYTPDFAVDDSLDPNLDLEIHDLEPDTPIEVATPITYSQPRTRPCVVSIPIKNPLASIHSRQSSMRPSISSLPVGCSPPKFSHRPSTISSHHTSSSLTSRKSLLQHPSPSPRSLTLPPSYDRRMSSTSIASGYPACEATPLDLSAPPVPSIRPDILVNASRESLLEGIEDRRSSGHVRKPNLVSSLRRSGLNSIMNYVKTPTRESAVSRPTTAVSSREVDESSRNAYSAFEPSVDDYPPPLRPRTATATSVRSWGENSVTALPTPPEPPMPSISRSSTFEVTRKKSLSALRNRSSSIGKALRSASSSVVPTISTMHMPSKPSFGISSESPSRNQSRKASVDLSSFPVPSPSPLMLGRSRNSPRMSPSVEKGGFA